jgi:lactate dehydrogenase-like 2-hydroxyacid dehydrogenase
MRGSSKAPMVLSMTYPGLREALGAAGFRTVPWPASECEWQYLVGHAPEIDALVTVGTMPMSEAFLAAATRLRIICCLGAGYDNYDPAMLARRGIKLTNSAGINAEDVADLTIGLLIAARRRIVEADKWVKEGRWPENGLYSRSIRGNHLGILGLGAVGRAVAVRGEAFAMSVGWYGPSPKPVAWRYFADPVQLARWCDVLCVCCRPTPENAGLIGEAVLNALGPQGILVNVARGSLVDENALIGALRSGRIAAAALDVFAKEPTDPRQWSGVPNLTLHPHSAGSTFEAIKDAQELTIENLRRFFADEPLLTLIN